MEQLSTGRRGPAVNHLTFQDGRRSLRAGVAAIAAILLSFVSPAASEPVRKSGYAVGTQTCGSGDLAFPKIPIDVKAGFCAGLVASEEDHLKFPRSIIQVPGCVLFVVADKNKRDQTNGRLLLLDPRAASGQRFK